MYENYFLFNVSTEIQVFLRKITFKYGYKCLTLNFLDLLRRKLNNYNP